jgi:hypothetical protein
MPVPPLHPPTSRLAPPLAPRSTPTAAVASLWVIIPNRYDFASILPAASGFLDAQKAGVRLAALPEASRAAYPWLETPGGAGDSPYGGFFMNGWDYVKVWGGGGGLGGGLVCAFGVGVGRVPWRLDFAGSLPPTPRAATAPRVVDQQTHTTNRHGVWSSQLPPHSQVLPPHGVVHRGAGVVGARLPQGPRRRGAGRGGAG